MGDAQSLPERSPKPSMLSPYNPGLSAKNCATIERVLTRLGVTEVLAGWGNMPHPTLKLARVDVTVTLDRVGVRPFTWDGLTVKDNPRHPSPPGRPLPMLGPKEYLGMSDDVRVTLGERRHRACLVSGRMQA